MLKDDLMVFGWRIEKSKQGGGAGGGKSPAINLGSRCWLPIRSRRVSRITMLSRSFPFDCLLGSIGLDRLLRLVLRGELLLYLDGDGLGVRLVRLRGAAENLAAIRIGHTELSSR